MKIDNIFNPSRAASLFCKYIVENRSFLLFSGVFILVVMLLIALISGMSVSFYSDDMGSDLVSGEIGAMLVAFFFLGCMIASISFGSLSKKSGAINILTNPSTALEQCAVRWVVILPVYLVWTIVCVWIADCVKYVLVKYVSGGSAAMLPWHRIFDVYSDIALENINIFMMVFVFFQSLFFLGAVFWHRHNFIKSFITVGLLFVLFLWTMAAVRVCVNNSAVYGVIFINERDILLYWPFQVMMWLGTVINYSLTVMRLKEYDIQGK